MTRNIFLIDPSLGAVDFTAKEFCVIRALADARGLTVAGHLKDVVAEYAARRKGIIVDFPSHNKTPAASDVMP
jgi:hypothetical protein